MKAMIVVATVGLVSVGSPSRLGPVTATVSPTASAAHPTSAATMPARAGGVSVSPAVVAPEGWSEGVGRDDRRPGPGHARNGTTPPRRGKGSAGFEQVRDVLGDPSALPIVHGWDGN